MKIKNIIELINDVKLFIEIKEKNSGASFGFYNKNDVIISELLEKEIVAINVQYINGKRVLVLNF